MSNFENKIDKLRAHKDSLEYRIKELDNEIDVCYNEYEYEDYVKKQKVHRLFLEEELEQVNKAINEELNESQL